MKYYIENNRELKIEEMLRKMEEQGEILPESTKVVREKEEE